MRRLSRVVVVSCAVVLFAIWFGAPNAAANPGNLAQEWLQEWCGGCGVNIGSAWVGDIAIGDVNSDGVPEIVAVGVNVSMYELTAYRWHDDNLDGVPELTLIQHTNFGPIGASSGSVAVAIGNFGGGGIQVATVGVHIISVNDWEIEINLWEWGFSTLVPVLAARATHHEGQATTPEAAVPTPPDATGRQDLIVAYHYLVSGTERSRIGRWTWQVLPVTQPLYVSPYWDGEVRDVALGDADNNGMPDVVSVGRTPYLGLMQWWEVRLTMFWKLGTDVTRGLSGYSFEGVAMANFDIGWRVIVAGGADFGLSGEYGELVRYIGSGGQLQYDTSSGSVPQRYYFDVALGQLDQDSAWEAVAVGASPVNVGYSGFSIWQQDAGAMSLETHHDVTPYSLLEATAAGDPDLDGVNEFLTGGFHHPASQATFAQLAAWTWSSLPTTDDWRVFHHSALHDGRSSSIGSPTGVPIWQATLSDGAGRYYHTDYSPVVADGRVFTRVHCPAVGYMESCVYAFDATTGGLLWGPVYTYNDYWGEIGPGSLAVADGKVFYGGAIPVPPRTVTTAIVGALDASNGNPIWEWEMPARWIKAAPTAVDGRVWVPVMTLPGPVRTVIYVFDYAGNPLFTFEPTPNPPGPPVENVFGTVAVWTDRAFIRSTTKVYAIPTYDPNGDGVISNPDEILWTFDLGSWPGSPWYAPDTWSSPSIVFPPGSSTPLVLVGSHDSPDYPGYAGGRVYALPVYDPDGDGVIGRTNEMAWVTPRLGDFVASTPAASGDRAFVGADLQFDPGRPVNSYLYALDLTNNGQIVGIPVSFGGQVDSSSAAVAEGGAVPMVYFVGANPGAPYLYYLKAYPVDLSAPVWSHLVHEHSTGELWIGNSPAISVNRVLAGNGVYTIQTNSNPDAYPFLFAFG